MDNLRSVIKNLFCYISPRQIITSPALYRGIDEKTFVNLGSSYITRYSKEELRNMFYFMLSEFDWQNRKINSIERGNNKNVPLINVFDTLTTFNFSVLCEENTEPLCQYPHLLRWRDVVVELEEDLFISSFLAKKDLLRGRTRSRFFWKPVIGHNNFELNKLVGKGIAENHFHLKGSAPMFHLAWINLMNWPENTVFSTALDKYDSERLQNNMEYGQGDDRDRYVIMWQNAALIRIYLFAYLFNDYIELPGCYFSKDDLLKLCDNSIRSKLEVFFSTRGAGERIDFLEYERDLLEDSSICISWKEIVELKQRLGKKYVQEHLGGKEFTGETSKIIQYNISRMRESHTISCEEPDYAICKGIEKTNWNNHVNETICGERWFMYAMFTKIYGETVDKGREEKNWFYAYLVYKAHIRREIIQSNLKIGFDNFLEYQNRKEEFIENTPLEPMYLKMALRDTIYNQNLYSLEARITPKYTADKLAESILRNDKAACFKLDKSKKIDLLKKYFYVVHFIKERDKNIEDEATVCRHYYKRSEVQKQSLALVKLREFGNYEAARIKGIDASSSEIGCRPEVFAQAFRYLKNHTAPNQYDNGSIISNLRATYHVGEDFLDIVDGLRAIDEAIRFLGLDCGDRLGHALALGIDVDEWYLGKAYRVLLSKQDYLDNLAWIYAKARKYKIPDTQNVLYYIEKRFDEYFQEVYISNISTMGYEKIAQEAQRHSERKKYQGYQNTNLQIGINEYYESWKLRGDDPDLYKNGFFDMDEANTDQWEYFATNKTYPLNYAIRYNPAVAFLYYSYHFNSRIRRIGEEMIEVKVSAEMIDMIKKIQLMLQRDVSNIGIGIETNPTSNYLISTFRRYDKHPIVKWYNTGLTYNEEELMNCPQIQVSINTDDQGVFSTYLENEYAYIALALEKKKNQNGERLYNRTFILQWLDNIRKMGIDMSFKDDVHSDVADEYLEKYAESLE